jgi:hypothetical protein
MTTYARIANGVAVEYPLYEGDLEKRFPDLRFPMDTHGTPIPDGYVAVKGTSAPQDWLNVYTLGLPTLQDGVWTMNWAATPRTEEEKASILEAIQGRVRKERDTLLAKCDWTQLADAPVNAASWISYRQALRDVPAQAGFPWEVVWPEQP